MRKGHVHLYLTAPFVLSWSFLDAMSTGALIVASDCAPVREFMEDGTHGLLTDMYDQTALIARITHALDNRANLTHLQSAARARILGKLDDKAVSYPARLEWLTNLRRKQKTDH